MKLGFWNRLAFVASVLAMIVLPVWGVADTNGQAGDIAGLTYSTCLSLAEEKPTTDQTLAEDRRCSDQFNHDFAKFKATWGTYFVGLLFTVILCAVAYGVLWVVGLVAKWVWRGRQIQK